MGNKLAARVRSVFGDTVKLQTPADGISRLVRDDSPLTDTPQIHRPSNLLFCREDAKRFNDINELDQVVENAKQVAQTIDNNVVALGSGVADAEVVDILGNFTRVDSLKLCASSRGDKVKQKKVL